MDPLLAWRKEFPILSHTTYMISHSLGAMPERTTGRLREFSDTWATRGIRAWEEGWWNMPITVGNLVASIIGAGEGEVVMQQNVSICQRHLGNSWNPRLGGGLVEHADHGWQPGGFDHRRGRGRSSDATERIDLSATPGQLVESAPGRRAGGTCRSRLATWWLRSSARARAK